MKAPTRKKIWYVAGESRRSATGQPRQLILHAAEPGDPVTLLREPKNPHDTNAILVKIASHDIGYITRPDAEILAPLIDAGTPFDAAIHEIRGGVRDAPSVGVRVSVIWAGQKPLPSKPPDDEQEEFRERAILKAKHGKAGSGCLGICALIAIAPALAVAAISFA